MSVKQFHLFLLKEMRMLKLSITKNYLDSGKCELFIIQIDWLSLNPESS